MIAGSSFLILMMSLSNRSLSALYFASSSSNDLEVNLRASISSLVNLLVINLFFSTRRISPESEYSTSYPSKELFGEAAGDATVETAGEGEDQ